MNNASGIKIKRLRRRVMAKAFMRKNGIYVLAALCFAMIAGAVLLMSRDPEPNTAPAGNSMDERLGETQKPSSSASPTAPVTTPAPTLFAVPTAEPTPAPTVMPEMTARPSEERSEPKPVYEPPVNGRLIRGYAMDCLIWSKTLSQWMTHSGVDISAEAGTEIYAIAAGKIERVYQDDLMGNTVVILHEGGMRSVYMSLDGNIPVAEGDEVSARSLIGYVGSSAISECAEEAHLHFEITVEGTPVDPSDMIVFKRGGE